MKNILKDFFSRFLNSTIFNMIIYCIISMLVLFWSFAFFLRDSKNLNEWYSFPLFVSFCFYIIIIGFFIAACIGELEDRTKK
jgi:hypothetical protein